VEAMLTRATPCPTSAGVCVLIRSDCFNRKVRYHADDGQIGLLAVVASRRVNATRAKCVLVGVGGDASFVHGAALKVDFNAWTQGASLPISELKGVLEGMATPLVRSKAAKNAFQET
jgi:hypothetical protein